MLKVLKVLKVLNFWRDGTGTIFAGNGLGHPHPNPDRPSSQPPPHHAQRTTGTRSPVLPQGAGLWSLGAGEQGGSRPNSEMSATTAKMANIPGAGRGTNCPVVGPPPVNKGDNVAFHCAGTRPRGEERGLGNWGVTDSVGPPPGSVSISKHRGRTPLVDPLPALG